MLETVQQRNNHLSAIERARNSVVVAYILHDNATVADDAVPQLYDKLQAAGKQPRIDLLLNARGGIQEAVWRVLNLMRDYCDHLSVIVGTKVQGPASLLALGADEIVMGPLAELGSMDGARRHPLLPRDELGQPVPVTWGELASLLGSGATDRNSIVPVALYNYIHPLALAHLREGGLLSEQLARKALGMHMQKEDESRIGPIAAQFTGGSGSPLYSASRTELQEMGLPVTVPDDALWKHIWELTQLYGGAIYSERADAANPGAFARYVCIIESVGRSTGLRQIFTQIEGMERIAQVGWETAIKGPGGIGD